MAEAGEELHSCCRHRDWPAQLPAQFLARHHPLLHPPPCSLGPTCREARHPFLDEVLVAATLAAPLWHLADLRQPPGQGDKRVLRACLARLGLPRAARRAKRAIQFGSRLAAKSNKEMFGGTHRAGLANAGSVRLSAVPLPQPE